MGAIITIGIVLALGIWLIRKVGGNDSIDASARQSVKSVNQAPSAAPTWASRSTAVARPNITDLCWAVKDDGSDSERLMDVAGAKYNTHTVRGIYGTVQYEFTNNYNPRAMVVMTADKEKIGYISERDLEDYWEWTDGKPFPFVGFVNRDYNGTIYSTILVIRPTSKFAVLDAARRQVKYLTKEYDTTGRFNPRIPDVNDEELYQMLRKANEAKEVEKKEAPPKKPSARREKWGTYLANFEMLEITKAAASKAGRELSFMFGDILYGDDVKSLPVGLFYGQIKQDDANPGGYAVYNRQKRIVALSKDDAVEFAKFNGGKPIPAICEIKKEVETDELEAEITWEIEGEGILPISEEYVIPEMQSIWASYNGNPDKLPK